MWIISPKLSLNPLVFLFLFSLSKHCLCSNNLEIIRFNTLRNCSVFSHSPLDFQIPGNVSLGFGTFDISVTALNESNSSGFFINRQKCKNHLDSKNVQFGLIYSSQSLSGISFHANASENQCLRLELVTSMQNISVEFAFHVTFTPIPSYLELNKPLDFEILGNKEKKFPLHLGDHPIEILLVTINSNQDLNLELELNKGMCINSQTRASLSKTWLCNVMDLQDPIVFSVYNNGSPGSYRLIINEIKPQEVSPNTQTEFSNSIPGFGTLFIVNVSDIGTLKIKANSNDGQLPLITISNSLYYLFGIIEQLQTVNILEKNINDRSTTVIQNTKANNTWYFFIPETKTKRFTLASYFIKQETINVGSEMIFYIDPEKYEYQHIKVILIARSFLERYEAVLNALQSDSHMNLYYDANFHEIASPLSTTQNFFHKQTSKVLVSESKVSLPFVVGTYDSSIYLTIHVSKKGYYKLRVNQVEPTNSIEILFIVILVSCIIIYGISILAKIYKLSKSDEQFQQTNPWSGGIGGHNIEGDISSEGFEGEMQSQPTIDQREAVNKSKTNARLFKKLEKQKEIEQLLKTKEKQTHNDQCEIEIDFSSKDAMEDDKCNICYELKKSVIFEPCNHNCSCAFCALIITQTSDKCPLCREKIIEVRIVN